MSVKLLDNVTTTSKLSQLYMVTVGTTLDLLVELLKYLKDSGNSNVEYFLNSIYTPSGKKAVLEFEVDGIPIVINLNNGRISVYTQNIYKSQVLSKFPTAIDLFRYLLTSIKRGGSNQGKLKPPNFALRGGVKIPNPIVKDQKPPKELREKTMSQHVKGMDFIHEVVKVSDAFHKEYEVEGYQRYSCGDKVCISAEGKGGKIYSLSFDPKKWVFVEADLLASVQPLEDNHTLDPDFLPYVNSKSEVIRAKDFIKYYMTHLGAYVFTNHNQDTDKQKGVIVDVVLREEKVAAGSKKPVLYSTGLLAINRADDPKLCEAIEKDQIRFGSMGSIYPSQTCSYCGKVGLRSASSDTRCIHLKMLKGTYYNMADGTRNRIVEWWNDFDEEGNPSPIEFIEYSLLVCKNGQVGGVCEGLEPAFSGAVVQRKEVQDDQPVVIKVPELYLKKPAFQKYLKNGEIKING